MSDALRSGYGKEFENIVKTMNKYSEIGKKAKVTLKDFNEEAEKMGKTAINDTSVMEDFGNRMSSIGKTIGSVVGNTVLNLGISFALQKAGEAWDNYSNKQEYAIQKGNDALDNYKQTNQNMQSATSWISANEDRYVELASKATKFGEQGSLTNAEFQEYNQLSAQMAQYLPSQVSGYNSLGTAIVSVRKGVDGLNSALTTRKLVEYGAAARDASDIIEKYQAEMYQSKTDFTQESGITNQKDAIDNFLDLYDNGVLNPHSFADKATKYVQANAALTADMKEAMKNAGIEKTGAMGFAYSQDDLLNPDNIESLRAYSQQLESNADESVESIKDILPAFLQANKDYQELIDKSPELDSEIATLYNGFNRDTIERIAGGDLNGMEPEEVTKKFRDWSNKLVTNLQDPETQKAFQNLFSIDDDKASLSFQDYEKKATDAVDAVSKKTSAFTKDELKQQSGITDSLDEMQTAYNNIADRFGKDKGFSEDYIKNQLSANDMLTLGSMATDDQYKDLSYNDALEKISVTQRQNELSVENLQKSVDTITSQYSTVSSAIQESMSDTGLTKDSITAIKSSVQDVIDSSEELKDFDLDGLFTNTSKGVKLNNSQLENLLDIQKDIKEQDFAESIEQQTEALEKQTKEAESLKKQYGETSDEYVNALEKQKQAQEDLNATQQAQSQYYAQYQQQKQLFSDYAEWQRATQTANSGDKYLSMVSGLETAKKAFDAGEVGTDDFKTFAKMISPSGSTDAANFAENYGKAARYLTEDESGLLNFFQDLSTKTDAAGEKMAKFNEETQSWELNVHDLGEIAQTLGTGTPLVEALFGRAEDYGATSTVISDMQDGILKSTEATKNWSEAKARLDRMNEENAQAQQDGKDPIYNTTAIQAAEDEVAKYQKQIDGLQESMDYYEEHNLGSEAQQKKIKTAADEISNIQQKMQEAEKTNNQSLANAYRNLAKEKAAAAGITVDDDLNVTGNGKTAQEQLQEKSSSGSSSLSGTDFNYDKTSMTLDEIDSKINELQGKRATIDVDVEGEETVNALDTEISALEAQKIQVQIQTAVENGNSLQELLTLSDQELMTTVGCDASQVDAVRAEIQEMSGESVDLTVAMDSTQFVALINAITGETVEVPVEANTDGAVQETTSAIEGSNPKVTPEVDTSNVESQTQSAVQNATQGAKPSVDVTGNITTLTAGTGLTPVAVTGNVVQLTGTPSQPVDVKANITSINPTSQESTVNANANITGIVPTSEETVVNAKANITSVVGGENVNANVNATAHVTAVDNQTTEGTINYKKGNVEKADGTTSQGIINYKKGDVEKADGTVSTGIINYDLGNVATPDNAVATGVINYTLGSVAKPKAASAAGTFGQSRAYAQGSLTDLSAYAGGHVSLPRDEKALVNEVGTESIVRDGQWSLIPGGAHLENLKKGDIIFSASQTEDLLKRGATPGHARAYAQGSLSDLSPLSNAYSVGGLSLKFGGGLANKTSVSSGSSDTPATQKHTDAVQKDTSATKSNTKSTKDSTETFDWVKVHLEKFSEAVERISNQITDYISSALKISLLKKQMKAIDKQIVAEQQGYDAYMNKANSIGISDDYKNKVINGTLSIEDIDTSTDAGKKLAKDVKNFQTYYNSAIDCKDSVQELNNKLLELYETLANMPTEKAEKAIDKLKSKYESFSNIGDTISTGGSAISILTKTIKTDNPKLATALTNQRKAQTARNITKKTRAKASRDLKSATADAESTGNTLIKTSEKQTKSIGKKLKNAAKSSTDKATYNAIAQAVREGKPVNLKGLKGATLKYAKSYNSSLKQGNTIASKVKAGKTVKTSGMSGVLKSAAVAYNTDAKEKASAQKAYDTARKNDDKALQNLNKATDVKEAEYRKTSKAQQIVALNKDRNSYVIQNKLLDYQADNLKQQMEQRQKATDEASKNYEKDRKELEAAKKKQDSLQKSLLKDKSFTSSLSKDQLSKLKSGKSFSLNGLTGDNLKKGQKWLNQLNQTSTLTTKAKITQDALTKAVEESTAAEAEYAQMLVENAQKKLDNISDYYDSKMALTENKNSLLNNYMDRMQTRGYDLSSTFYTAQIANYKKIANDQKVQLAAMQKEFQNALDKGLTPDTKEYWDMQNAIDQVTISITETTNSIVDLQAKIRDLDWEQFDKGQEAVGRIASESDFLIKLLSHKDLYQKDTGKLTDEGLATMGLHGVNYNTYMAQADKYKEEMLKISKELANDPYNQKLIDRKNELVDAQQDAILSAEDEKDAMKDLVKDGIDKELDALKDLIDKYEKKLEEEKDLYDYEKRIRDKSEKVASLQKQLVALQGDNSEENKAKLQELRKNLKDAQEDLEDTQYDKYISDQKDLLDDFYDKYEEILNQRLDNIDTLIQDCINQVNSGSGKISDTINSASQNVNYTLSADMKQIWSSTDNVSNVISAYEKGTFTSQTTAVKTAVDNVWNRQKDMIDAINEMAEKYVQKSENDTQQQTPTKAEIGKVEEKAPKPETPKDKNNAVGTVGNETLSKKDDKGKTEGTLSDDDSPYKKTGNGKAEVGDKVTFASGVYHGASDGSGRTGNYYLGKQVKIAHINKGAPYPYSIISADGKTQLGWVKLNQLKGYASGIMKVPNDQLAWTQEQGEEAIVRNDGSILTPLNRDMSVLNADMTKNLWNFMGNPGSFLNDYSNGEKFGVKNESSSIVNQFDNLTFNLPNVQNSDDFIKEMANSKTFEKMVCAMTVDRLNGGSSLKKYKYRS